MLTSSYGVAHGFPVRRTESLSFPQATQTRIPVTRHSRRTLALGPVTLNMFPSAGIPPFSSAYQEFRAVGEGLTCRTEHLKGTNGYLDVCPPDPSQDSLDVEAIWRPVRRKCPCPKQKTISPTSTKLWRIAGFRHGRTTPHSHGGFVRIEVRLSPTEWDWACHFLAQTKRRILESYITYMVLSHFRQFDRILQQGCPD